MDDLIKREDAIGCCNCHGSIDCINRINALPSADVPYMFSEAYMKQLRFERDYLLTIVNGQWIPCSERLPDDLAEVNVTWVNHDPEPYYDFVKDKPASASAVFYKGKWFWYSSVCTDILAEYGENDIDEVDNAIEILAWMPLPEPYREEGEEE